MFDNLDRLGFVLIDYVQHQCLNKQKTESCSIFPPGEWIEQLAGRVFTQYGNRIKMYLPPLRRFSGMSICIYAD